MRDAASEEIAILFPDTSPRGAGIDGEDADWDFGTGEFDISVRCVGLITSFLIGAGFYLNATSPTYSKHYNMATHVTQELPQILEQAGIPVVSLPRLFN